MPGSPSGAMIGGMIPKHTPEAQAKETRAVLRKIYDRQNGTPQRSPSGRVLNGSPASSAGKAAPSSSPAAPPSPAEKATTPLKARITAAKAANAAAALTPVRPTPTKAYQDALGISHWTTSHNSLDERGENRPAIARSNTFDSNDLAAAATAAGGPASKPEFDLRADLENDEEDDTQTLGDANFESVDLPYRLGSRAALTVVFTNSGAEPLCYKVKTSNPKRYAVTPAVALVMPGDCAPIAIGAPPSSSHNPQTTCPGDTKAPSILRHVSDSIRMCLSGCGAMAGSAVCGAMASAPSGGGRIDRFLVQAAIWCARAVSAAAVAHCYSHH
eukprot:COSAG05_NODE_276_length_12393_cov_1737.505694_9_plen_329_part_00